MAWRSAAQVKLTRTAPTKLTLVAEINGYSSWYEVTQKPVEMAPNVALACAPSSSFSRSTPPPTVQGTQGPHRKKYIRVYVNALAQEPMIAQKSPRFPVGSVVVKEKLPLIESKNQKTGKPQQKIGAKPELLTVMIKRERGYDVPNGDWEYLVTDGTGKRVSQRGQTEACQSCHQPYQKTDYIVRSYLPKEIAKALQEADASLATKESTTQKSTTQK